jgi:hypothetical protein
MNDGTNSVVIEPEELIQELRRLRERVPNYGQLPLQRARSMVRVAHLNPEFVSAGLSAARAYPGTQSLTGMTSEALWKQNEDAARWTGVEDELSAMLAGVKAANLTRRHTLGQAILQIYTVLRGLIKKKEHSDLIPFVELMKEANHIRGKSQKAADDGGEQPAP